MIGIQNSAQQNIRSTNGENKTHSKQSQCTSMQNSNATFGSLLLMLVDAEF
jgi:hypothetical protein